MNCSAGAVPVGVLDTTVSAGGGSTEDVAVFVPVAGLEVPVDELLEAPVEELVEMYVVGT